MKITILGSGAGGTAIAWDCANAGHTVSLCDFDAFPENIAAIKNAGGIQSSGVLKGFATVHYAGHDFGTAIHQADFIFLVGPAYSTAPFAEVCQKHLLPDQTIVICPGSTGGAFEFKHQSGLELNAISPVIAETSTLPYAVRLTDPGHIQVFHKLTAGNYIATLPAGREGDIIARFSNIFPLEAAKNVWQTSLQNGNPVIHPAVTVSNAARIEDLQGDFFFYEQGVTRASGKLMQGVDNERIAIGNKLDVKILSDPQLGVIQKYMQSADYYDGYRKAPGFLGIKAQSSLDHRYLHEDVGYGLVFLAELGKKLGVQTPVIDAVITVASIMTGKDYRTEAKRSLATLGLNELSTSELISIDGGNSK